MPSASSKSWQDPFLALAHEERRAILLLLCDHAQSAGDMARYLDTTQQSASHHLNLLLNNELVSVEKRGRFRFYITRLDGLQEVEEFLVELRTRAARRTS